MTEHNKLDQFRIELDAEFRYAKAEHDARVEYTSKTQALRREPNSGDFFISDEIIQEEYFRELSEKGEENA